MKFSKPRVVVALLAALSLAASLPARAANNTLDVWAGSTSSLWSTAGDWTTPGGSNAAPTSSNNFTAEFNSAPTNEPVLNAAAGASGIWVTTGVTGTTTITSASTAETLTLAGTGSTTSTPGTFAIQVDDSATKGLTIGSTTAANNVNLSLLNSTSFNDDVATTLTVDGNVTDGSSSAITLTLYGVTSSTDTENGVISDGSGSAKMSIDVTHSGTVNMNGLNTYTGTTSIDGGTLTTANLFNGGVASGLGQSSNAASNLLLAGGGLSFNGSTAVSTDRLFTIGDSTGTGTSGSLGASGTSTSATETFSNTGSIAFYTNNTAYTLNLNGTNMGENIFDPAIGDDGTGKTSVNHNSGVGLWILNGTNTYTGTTTVTTGGLGFGQEVSLYDDNTSSWTASNIKVLSGASLVLSVGGSSGTNFTNSDIQTILNMSGSSSTGFETGSAIGFDPTAGNFTVTENIANAYSGSTLGVSVYGAGNTVTLTPTTGNTYTGTTTVNGATLAAGAANAFGAGPLTVNTGGTLDLSSYNDTANTTVTLSGGTIESTGGGALNATTAYALQSGTISAPLTGSATVTKTTTGQVTLSGADTYSAPTTISAGILEFSTEASLYNDTTSSWIPANIIVSSSGATLALGVGGTGQFTSSDVSTFLGDMASSSGSTGLESGSIFALDASNASGGVFTYTGNAIADTNAGPLIFSTVGTGTVSLPNANTYSGGTLLEAGSTISVGNNSSLGSGTITMGQATTTGNANFTSSAPVTLANALLIENTTFTGTNSLTFSGAVTDNAYNSNAAARYLTNNLSGGATLTFSNTGAFTLGLSTAAASNYAFTGSGTTIIDGVLTATASGNGSGFVYTGTGMIELEAAASSVHPVGYTYIGGGATGVGTVREDVSNALSNATTADIKLYSGTLELNTNVIQTDGSGGLQIGGDGTTAGGAGSTANLLLESGSIFELNAGLTYNPTGVAIGQATISGPGTFDLFVPGTGTGANTRMFAVTASTGTGGGPDLVISSAIANGNSYANGISKTGTGYLYLSGTNTFTGTIADTAGTLEFANEGSLYDDTTASWTSTNITVNSGATFVLGVGGSGDFTQSDVQAILGIASSSSAGFKTGANIGFDTTDGNFTYGNAIGNSYSGSVTGVSVYGTHTLVLNQTETYTGPTTIISGNLEVDGSTSTGAVNVTGGMLSGSGTIGGLTTTSSGSALAPGTVGTAGTLTFSNNLVLAGGTTLQFDLGANQAASDFISVNGTLTTTGSTSITFAFNNLATPTSGQMYNVIGFTGSAPSLTQFTSTGDTGSFTISGQDVVFTFSGVAAVPEPSTWVTMLLGMLGIVYFGRRRARR